MKNTQDENGGSRSVDHIVGPRVRTVSKSRNEFEGRYKGHDIYIRRENRNDPWYITVTDSEGCRAYDGWWTDPEREGRIATLREAIIEACKGALLWPNSNSENTKG
jgi:hypothetical protein